MKTGERRDGSLLALSAVATCTEGGRPMTWSEIYPKTTIPDEEQINAYIDNPLWNHLCAWLVQNGASKPKTEYSTCSGAPGWNVKYRKGGRALCTLYPRRGYFICLVSIGTAEATEAELLLPTRTEAVQQLFGRTKPLNGGRWLMIDVTDGAILADVEALISLRMKGKASAVRG